MLSGRHVAEVGILFHNAMGPFGKLMRKKEEGREKNN